MYGTNERYQGKSLHLSKRLFDLLNEEVSVRGECDFDFFEIGFEMRSIGAIYSEHDLSDITRTTSANFHRL